MTRTMTASRETPQEKSVRLVEDGGVTEVGVNEYTVTSGNKQYRVNDGKCDCDAARWGNPRCSRTASQWSCSGRLGISTSARKSGGCGTK